MTGLAPTHRVWPPPRLTPTEPASRDSKPRTALADVDVVMHGGLTCTARGRRNRRADRRRHGRGSRRAGSGSRRSVPGARSLPDRTAQRRRRPRVIARPAWAARCAASRSIPRVARRRPRGELHAGPGRREIRGRVSEPAGGLAGPPPRHVGRLGGAGRHRRRRRFCWPGGRRQPRVLSSTGTSRPPCARSPRADSERLDAGGAMETRGRDSRERRGKRKAGGTRPGRRHPAPPPLAAARPAVAAGGRNLGGAGERAGYADGVSTGIASGARAGRDPGHGGANRARRGAILAAWCANQNARNLRRAVASDTAGPPPTRWPLPPHPGEAERS